MGLEPTIFGSEVRRLIHWATRPSWLKPTVGIYCIRWILLYHACPYFQKLVRYKQSVWNVWGQLLGRIKNSRTLCCAATELDAPIVIRLNNACMAWSWPMELAWIGVVDKLSCNFYRKNRETDTWLMSNDCRVAIVTCSVVEKSMRHANLCTVSSVSVRNKVLSLMRIAAVYRRG